MEYRTYVFVNDFVRLLVHVLHECGQYLEYDHQILHHILSIHLKLMIKYV